MKQWSFKDPAEIVPVEFDFTDNLAAIDGVVISITVVRGIDAGAAAMLFGSANISGSVVSQLIRNGVHGADYIIRADVTGPGGVKLAIAAKLPVRTIS